MSLILSIQTQLLSSSRHSQHPLHYFSSLFFSPPCAPSISPRPLCKHEAGRRRWWWWWGVVKHFSSFLIVLTCAIGIPIRPHWFPTAKCIDFYISHWSPLLNLPTHTLCVCLSLSLREHHAARAWACICVCVRVWERACEWKTEREGNR